MPSDAAIARRQGTSGHAGRVDRDGGLAADKPNDKRQDDRDDDAGRDRKVENAALSFNANVSRQAPKTESGEPWPYQSNHQENRPDGDQNPLHVRHRTAGRVAKERGR